MPMLTWVTNLGMGGGAGTITDLTVWDRITEGSDTLDVVSWHEDPYSLFVQVTARGLESHTADMTDRIVEGSDELDIIETAEDSFGLFIVITARLV